MGNLHLDDGEAHVPINYLQMRHIYNLGATLIMDEAQALGDVRSLVFQYEKLATKIT